MIADVIRRFFALHGIPPCRMVVALSGGTDSTALLLAMHELGRDGFEIFGAHVNHHLRGEESEADEAFVRTLCASLDVELAVTEGHLDTTTRRERGLEAAAREVRYARLREVRERIGARWIATAHQMDDQAETVLMRLRHGSGIEGLRGIRPLREDGFVRPLLDVRRHQLEVFLRERGIVPRHDRSNDDLRFERNRVRAFLRGSQRNPGEGGPPGPELQLRTPREADLVPILASVAAHARDVWPAIEQAIEAAEAAHVLETAGMIRFVGWPEERWLREAILRRAISRLDRDARDVSREDLARLTDDHPLSGRVTITKRLELVSDDGSLILQPRRTVPVPPRFESRLTPDEPALIPGFRLSMGRIAGVTPEASRAQAMTGRRPGAARVQVIQLPDGASPEFTVRNRRAGDLFQPLGLPAPKRLKELLIDRKIDAELRDTIPLLVWNGEIVWIPGVEVSERFKVTSPAGVHYEVRMEVSGAGDDDAHANVHH